MYSNRTLTLTVTGSEPPSIEFDPILDNFSNSATTERKRAATRSQNGRFTRARGSLRKEDLHRAAQILITIYGTRAKTFAEQRARHAALSNAKAGARLWRRIAGVFGTTPIGGPHFIDLWSGGVRPNSATLA
jgi:hypothetical protein